MYFRERRKDNSFIYKGDGDKLKFEGRLILEIVYIKIWTTIEGTRTRANTVWEEVEAR